MKRVATAATLIALMLAAVGTASGAGTHRSAGATKLTVWVGWSARELSAFRKLAAEYQKANPSVALNVVGSINDDKIVAAIRAGTAPDVVSSFNSYDVGVYCGTGGWIDLSSLMKGSGITTSMFPATTNYYTQYGGKKCALPLLADAYGLYYNKALFKKAGITHPPKTTSELTAERRNDLQATFHKLPAFLTELRPTMVSLGRTADNTSNTGTSTPWNAGT